MHRNSICINLGIMDYGNYNISEFSKNISRQLRGNKYKIIGFQNIKNFPLIRGKQCLYVINWKDMKLTFTKGIKEMLGYEDEELNMKLLLNLVHPEDLKFVNRIVKGIVTHSIENNISGEDQYIKVTYRLQKKDKSFLNVLRISSPHEINIQGNLVSNLSLLTDISFISNNNKVEWDVYINDIDVERFKQNVYKEFSNFFTERELEIIKYIQKGYSSRVIAEKLYVSFHTITTHRKNILRKSRCHTVIELLDFCKKNGIL